MKFKPKKDSKNSQKITQMRQNIIKKIGEPLFKKIYDFVFVNKKNGLNENNVSSKDTEEGKREFWEEPPAGSIRNRTAVVFGRN